MTGFVRAAAFALCACMVATGCTTSLNFGIYDNALEQGSPVARSDGHFLTRFELSAQGGGGAGGASFQAGRVTAGGAYLGQPAASAGASQIRPPGMYLSWGSGSGPSL